MNTLSEEVGKMIANTLLAGEAVALPEVGSLQVKRVPARKVGRGAVVPPCRRVEYTAESVGLSLVAMIADAAHCNEELARDAYSRWLTKAMADGGLRIEGVGTLQGRLFTPEAPFEKRLNPRGHAPVKVRRKMPWWSWSLLTLLLIFALFGGLALVVNPLELWKRWSTLTEVALQPAETPAPEAEEPMAESQPAADTVAAPVVAPAPQPAPDSAPQPAPEEIVRTRSGMSYVVLGIYSTEQNARRAVELAVKQYGITSEECRLYYYGEKYLVALAETEKRVDAQQIAARYRTDRGIKDVWVYSKN